MSFRFVISCAAILLVAVSAWAGKATLIKAQGSVWVTPPAGKEAPASTGVTLAPGTRIRTGAASGAELQFENGSILKVRANTSMSLSGHKRQTKKRSSLLLFFGRVWSKVVGDGDGYKVSTANAVAGVRGTEFEVAAADDGSIRVRVTQGEVAVDDGEKSTDVGAGHEVDAGQEGLGDARSSSKPKWKRWEKQGRENLRTGGRGLVDKMKDRIMARKAKIEALLKSQKKIESARRSAEQRAKRGERGALDEIRKYNAELAEIADAIADLGDQAESQFAVVDHFADLAEDPKFRMVDRKYLVSQAESLRRVKADLDAMVADGTDISIEAMDELLEDMGSGEGGGLLDRKGSSADELFGPDDMMK